MIKKPIVMLDFETTGMSPDQGARITEVAALRLVNGRIWGTLCHFDVRPRLLAPAERSVLESVGPMFVAVLQPEGGHSTVSAQPSPAPRDSVAQRT